MSDDRERKSPRTPSQLQLELELSVSLDIVDKLSSNIVIMCGFHVSLPVRHIENHPHHF